MSRSSSTPVPHPIVASEAFVDLQRADTALTVSTADLRAQLTEVNKVLAGMRLGVRASVKLDSRGSFRAVYYMRHEKTYQITLATRARLKAVAEMNHAELIVVTQQLGPLLEALLAEMQRASAAVEEALEVANAFVDALRRLA